MSEAKEESALDGVVICPRCDKEVKSREIGGELSHVKCAQDELDEIGWDDDWD